MEEEKDFEIRARLNVTKFLCDPSVITNLLGIPPDRTWLSGDPVVKGAANIHKQNGWSVFSPRSGPGISVDEQISALREILFPKIKGFTNLPNNSEVELLLVIYANKFFPDIYVSVENISFLSEIDASIDVDVYDLIE